MKAIIALFAFVAFLSVLPIFKPVFALRSLIISSDKTSLFGYEEMIVNASASGFTNGETIYIKGAFYKEATSNYFGYTKNGDNWIKNGDSAINQKTFKAGEWDGDLIIKSDFLDSGFTGEGDYKFKIGFYYLTSGGNLSSVNWSSNNLSLNLNEPDYTPTSSPTPTSKPTNTPTSTKTPTPTSKPSLTLTPIATSVKTPTDSVLGEATKSALPTKEEEKVDETTESLSSKPDNLIGKIFIFLGIIFLLACAIVIAYPLIVRFKREKLDG